MWKRSGLLLLLLLVLSLAGLSAQSSETPPQDLELPGYWELVDLLQEARAVLKDQRELLEDYEKQATMLQREVAELQSSVIETLNSEREARLLSNELTESLKGSERAKTTWMIISAVLAVTTIAGIIF